MAAELFYCGSSWRKIAEENLASCSLDCGNAINYEPSFAQPFRIER